MQEHYVVAVHRYWPSSHYTTGVLAHVGPFATNAEAWEYADNLELPLVGFISMLKPPKDATPFAEDN